MLSAIKAIKTVTAVDIIPPGKVLVVFPHPDDETMFAGGLLAQLSYSDRHQVHVQSITPGEKGNELVNLPEAELAEMRRQEMSRAMRRLGVKQHTVADFNDGQLMQQQAELRNHLQQQIQQLAPVAIVTYEAGGLYGHSDHVALSRVVTDLVVNQFPEVVAVYVTLPVGMLRRLRLPLHMAPGPVQPQPPQYRLNAIPSLWRKHLAMREYRSQNLNRGFPSLVMSLMLGYEYYTTVHLIPTVSESSNVN